MAQAVPVSPPRSGNTTISVYHSTPLASRLAITSAKITTGQLATRWIVCVQRRSRSAQRATVRSSHSCIAFLDRARDLAEPPFECLQHGIPVRRNHAVPRACAQARQVDVRTGGATCGIDKGGIVARWGEQSVFTVADPFARRGD